MQDEALSTTGAEKDHYQGCATCRERAMAIATEAENTGMLMAVPDPEVDSQLALQRLRRSAASQMGFNPTVWTRLAGIFASGGSRTVRPVAALALATALMVALVATGVAENFVKIFEPQQFQAVQVRPDELKGLPDLSQFGDMKFTKAPNFMPVADAAAAQSQSGLSLRSPADSAIPSRAQGNPVYVVMSPLQASFTFSAAKAQAWASSHGKSLPSMPAGLDGSTLSVNAGPGIVTVYGGSADLIRQGVGSANQGTRQNSRRGSRANTPPATESSNKPGAVQDNGGPRSGSGGGVLSSSQIPTMAVVEMTTPVVSSSGASVTQIEDYLVSLPGFPPDLAAQIRNIGDPSTTLPVPVPTGQQSHQVDVNGSKGLFVGDSTGLGSGLVWTRDGVLYATVGTMTEDEVTGVARSVH
jgi:hypothetical protein